MARQVAWAVRVPLCATREACALGEGVRWVRVRLGVRVEVWVWVRVKGEG